MVGLVVALFALLAGPAAGTVVDSGHYSGTDSFSFDDCGFTLNGEEQSEVLVALGARDCALN